MGPLPPPQLLFDYDRLLPGAADRIITMAEKQADHRIALETKVIGSDITRSYVGIAAGLVVSLAVIGLGYILVLREQALIGAVLSGVDVTALAGLFVYGTNSRKEERVHKQRSVEQASESPPLDPGPSVN